MTPDAMPEPPMSEDVEAFPRLDGADLALFDALGSRRSMAAGEFLYREGDATYDFYVVVSGAVEILVHADGGELVVTRHVRGVSWASEPADRHASVRLRPGGGARRSHRGAQICVSACGRRRTRV